MQSKYFILLLAILCTLISCKDDDDQMVVIYDAGDQEFGWATGTREGHAWEASGYWRYHQNDSTYWGINFVTYSSYGAMRESYALNEIPFAIGTFPVKGGLRDLGDGFVGGNYGRLADDGDASLGTLPINDDEDGFITISSIDSTTNTIKGFFEVYFRSEDHLLKIEIKDGEFEVTPYR